MKKLKTFENFMNEKYTPGVPEHEPEYYDSNNPISPLYVNRNSKEAITNSSFRKELDDILHQFDYYDHRNTEGKNFRRIFVDVLGETRRNYSTTFIPSTKIELNFKEAIEKLYNEYKIDKTAISMVSTYDVLTYYPSF